MWPYRQADGRVLFHICRYESANAKKSVIPWHLVEDGSWQPGQPLEAGRPVFRLPELLESNLPVLIVEGEKCATVSTPPDFPFFISTWSGGAGATGKTDWSPLKDREVVVWPDADKPGREAALKDQSPTTEGKSASSRGQAHWMGHRRRGRRVDGCGGFHQGLSERKSKVTRPLRAAAVTHQGL